MAKKNKSANHNHGYEKIVYLLQGGGALGAFQAGACEQLSNLGFDPDWVIGTSIGAIHSAIIAGNVPEDRVKALQHFWQKVSLPLPFTSSLCNGPILRRFYNLFSAQWTLLFGVPGFFKPRIINPWLGEFSLEKISFYDPFELRETLNQLVDFDRINSNQIRLSLGATQLDTGELIHFDSTKQKITVDHIMASAALPPAFPPVKINGKFYWDGGVSANTPLSILLEEPSGHKLLCFMMNLFSPSDLYPTGTLDDALRIQKDIIYSSHYREVIRNHYIVQRLRHAIRVLGEKVPHDELDQKTKALVRLGQTRVIKLVRFHYRGQKTDLSSKDYNFSPLAITEHMESGFHDVKKAFKDTSWLKSKKDDVGIILHEF